MTTTWPRIADVATPEPSTVYGAAATCGTSVIRSIRALHGGDESERPLVDQVQTESPSVEVRCIVHIGHTDERDQLNRVVHAGTVRRPPSAARAGDPLDLEPGNALPAGSSPCPRQRHSDTPGPRRSGGWKRRHGAGRREPPGAVPGRWLVGRPPSSAATVELGRAAGRQGPRRQHPATAASSR